jgi:hypothetical protein
MTNHGTDVGWSCYWGGRVSEVENLGWISWLLIPAKQLSTLVSLACMHDWGDARSPFHDKNSYFLEKDYYDISIIIELIILSYASWVNILAARARWLLRWEVLIAAVVATRVVVLEVNLQFGTLQSRGRG